MMDMPNPGLLCTLFFAPRFGCAVLYPRKDVVVDVVSFDSLLRSHDSEGREPGELGRY